MRKQELVHLHALCRMIRRHVEEREDPPPGAFDAYDSYGLPPTAIHRRKDDHEEALSLLLSGIIETIDDRSRVSPSDAVE